MVITNNKINKIQKNRFFKKPKKFFNKFGDCGLICKNEGRLELIHINIIRKKVKSFIVKKKSESDVVREKIWYFGRPNFLIQKKSKNSRMGKGKGLVERKVIRVRKNFKILEFKGILPVKIHKLVKFLNKILSVKVYINFDYTKNFSCLCKQNKYDFFYEKYLFQ